MAKRKTSASGGRKRTKKSPGIRAGGAGRTRAKRAAAVTTAAGDETVSTIKQVGDRAAEDEAFREALVLGSEDINKVLERYGMHLSEADAREIEEGFEAVREVLKRFKRLGFFRWPVFFPPFDR